MASLTAAPRHQHWALADSALLQAIARKEPVQRGPRGRRLTRLLRWADRLGLARGVLLVTGCVVLLKLLHRQGRGRKQGGGGLPPHLFVGFGAGPEETLYTRYTSEHAAPVARLNQVDVASFGTWQRISLADAMSAFWAAQHAAWQAVADLPPPLCQWRLDFLTYAAMRLGHYSFMRAWFQRLNLQQQSPPQEVCFLAADTPAFAAVDAGLPTRYLQHGLIRHSMILPAFDQIDALTQDESLHFQRRLPRAEIHLASIPDSGAQGHSGGIMVASIYGERRELALVEPILEWANTKGLQLWVRPHPCEDRAYWTELANRQDVHIEDADPSFQAALQRLRPSLVVSWYSTALADALQCGIIPVTVNEASSPNVQDMVYPLMDRALQWPADHVEIEQTLLDTEQYRQTLRRLQHH